MSKKSNTDAEDILSELENQVDNQSITEDTKVEAVSYTHLTLPTILLV